MKLRDAVAGARLHKPNDRVRHPRYVEPEDDTVEHRLRIRRVARILAQPRDWYTLSKEERVKWVMLAGHATFAVEQAIYEEKVESLMAAPPPLRRPNGHRKSRPHV